MQFYGTKKALFKFNDSSHRNEGKSMPIEELIMDYVTIGTTIQNNETKNTEFSEYCQKCRQDINEFS